MSECHKQILEYYSYAENKTVWLAVESHMTNSNQSNQIIQLLLL